MISVEYLSNDQISNFINLTTAFKFAQNAYKHQIPKEKRQDAPEEDQNSSP
jgi:hypothetical protein